MALDYLVALTDDNTTLSESHMRAVLKGAGKTDRNDTRGLAQMMRVGLYRPAHVKTLRSQKLRMLLTHRKLLQAKAIAVVPRLNTDHRQICFGTRALLVF
jgi:hypothetical protein